MANDITTFSWVPPTSSQGMMNMLAGVAYGNGMFLTVSTKAEVFTSTDGHNWIQVASNAASIYTGDGAVSFGHGLFIYAPQEVILTSPDGVTWTQRWQPVSSAFRQLSSVLFANNMFVATGPNNTSISLYSYDGITWTPSPSGALSPRLQAATFGNGLFVACGYSGAVLTSSDGISWQSQTVGSSNWMTATFGNGTFLLAGGGNQATSTDGTSWTISANPLGNPSYFSGYGNGLFIVTGNGTALSNDTVSWQTQAPSPPLFAPGNASASIGGRILYAQDMFVIGTYTGIFTSPWEDAPPMEERPGCMAMFMA